MDEFSRALIKLVENTAIEKILKITRTLKSSDIDLRGSLSSFSKTPSGQKRLNDLLEKFEEEDFSREELSGMLNGAAFMNASFNENNKIDLVWTGPGTDFVPTRKTEQVMREMVRSAESKIFISSFVAKDIELILSGIDSSIERGVKVSLLIEGGPDGEGINEEFISMVKENHEEIVLYYWKEKKGDFYGGKVHSKIILVDEEKCFISSANLTGYALEKNIEAGVLIEGGKVPKNMGRHLESLISTKVFERI